MSGVRATLALCCVCGATFEETLLFDDPDSSTAVDLTGYDAVMAVDRGDRIVDYSVETGHLVVDGPAGTVSLTVPAHTTLHYPNPGAMNYELRLIAPSGEVRSWVSGSIVVLQTVRP